MVKKWNVTIPKLSGDTPRRAYIWLPEDYEENPDKRYPVMYMFDGHNVFFDEDATFGKSWGMAKFMQENPKDLIIVAVECNHEGNRRLVEYAPMTYTNSEHGHIKGKGSVMMNWMVKEMDTNLKSICYLGFVIGFCVIPSRPSWISQRRPHAPARQART